MTESSGLDFLVNRGDWNDHRFDENPKPELTAGQILFRVDRFAFTANNISYAVAGDMLGYWRFFPAPDGWGRLPVMGYGEVVGSEHSGVSVGTRCFGFYPMSRYVVIEPSHAGPDLIIEGAPHREGIAPFYNQFLPSTADPLYAPKHEDVLMLMRGLFMTAFLAEDFLTDQDLGEKLTVISSASSKTAIALAHCVKTQARTQAIGLTSQRNLEFVRSLGCYDKVLTYDEAATLDAATPVVFVDMAGNSALRRTIHEHFGDRLRHSSIIGATHWDQGGGSDDGLPGSKPAFFFAPGQAEKRTAEWGAKELQSRIASAWNGLREFTEQWMKIERGSGREAVAQVYEQTLRGTCAPQTGQILSLWD